MNFVSLGIHNYILAKNSIMEKKNQECSIHITWPNEYIVLGGEILELTSILPTLSHL